MPEVMDTSLEKTPSKLERRTSPRDVTKETEPDKAELAEDIKTWPEELSLEPEKTEMDPEERVTNEPESPVAASPETEVIGPESVNENPEDTVTDPVDVGGELGSDPENTETGPESTPPPELMTIEALEVPAPERIETSPPSAPLLVPAEMSRRPEDDADPETIDRSPTALADDMDSIIEPDDNSEALEAK
jgi:hypothetical protein